MTETTTSREGVARRLLSVLDAFEGTVVPLRLGTIAQRCGLPTPTTLRLVRELVEWGGLDRLEDGTYRVGIRMWAVGSLAPCVQRIQRETSLHLKTLAAVSKRTVVLAALVDKAALVIDRAGVTAGGVPVEIGERLPLHSTAVGKILLAHAPEGTSTQLAAAGLSRTTRYTKTSVQVLSADLIRVREKGIAREREEYRYGRYGIALGIPGPSGGTSAALGILGSGGADEAVWVGLLHEAIATVTHSIMR